MIMESSIYLLCYACFNLKDLYSPLPGTRVNEQKLVNPGIRKARVNNIKDIREKNVQLTNIYFYILVSASPCRLFLLEDTTSKSFIYWDSSSNNLGFIKLTHKRGFTGLNININT